MTAPQLDSDLERTIQARMGTLSSIAQTIAKDPRKTLVPSSVAPPHSGKTALETLQSIRRDPASLRLEETLGEGGMGVVRLGHQVTLDRRVAVKTLRSEHVSEETVESMLGEAWLAGSLEHPNVVPIYDLGLDERGAPLLVMKRIEGDAWCTLLDDPAAMRRHTGGQDPLEFNLRVLAQVCNAVHYAHSRDVVHRDLKPDNVMIGHFGEVYVLDWGVAMRPGPVRHVAGTVVYMAPEMLGGGADIGPHTDVYLLGAVLHELVTGKPPHDGPSVRAMVASVVVSEPRIDGDVPEELAELVRACMARDPAKRPASALDVRRALELFLEHRGAIALATQAEAKLADLERLLAASDVEIERAYNAFGECVFGFRQALRAWSDADVAKHGLRRAISAMVRFEAEHGDARAAARLLGDLDEPDPALAALVDGARRRAEEEAAKLEKLRDLERQLDPREGRRTRLVIGITATVVWTVVPALAPLWLAKYPDSETFSTIPVCVFMLVLLAVGRRLWRETSRINRQLVAMLAFGFALQPLAMLALRYGLHAAPRDTVMALMAYWCIGAGFMAVAAEWRLAPAAVGYGAAFLVALRWPEYRYWAGSLSNLVPMATIAVIWSRRGTEIAMERERRRRETGRSCEL